MHDRFCLCCSLPFGSVLYCETLVKSETLVEIDFQGKPQACNGMARQTCLCRYLVYIFPELHQAEISSVQYLTTGPANRSVPFHNRGLLIGAVMS